MYAFDVRALADSLGRLTTDNAQGEEYLTDVLGLQVAAGLPVAAVVAGDADEILGINDRAQLAAARALLRDRVNLGVDARRASRSSTRPPRGSTPTCCSRPTA